MIPASDLAMRWNLRARPGKREWRGTCPACDYAGGLVLTERDGKALFWCASCDNRDALTAAMRGGTKYDAAPVVPANPANLLNSGADSARKTARAAVLWRGAALCHGTPAATYLASRGLADLTTSPALRYRRDTPHPEGGTLPAMLATVVDVAGQPVALHRTYLRRDGTGKAEIEPNKASLGPVAGGAIRLHPVAPELVIGEGLETAASAGLLLALPAWAAISAGNLARTLALPAEVRAVVIAADADGPGRRAAEDAAARWQAEGRRIRIALPDRNGSDFNDVLRAVRHG